MVTRKSRRLGVDLIDCSSGGNAAKAQIPLGAGIAGSQVRLTRSGSDLVLAIAGAGEFLILTRWDKLDKGVMLNPPSLGPQPERNCVDPAEAFFRQASILRPGGI